MDDIVKKILSTLERLESDVSEIKQHLISKSFFFWTKKDETFLKDNYLQMSDREMASRIGRGIKAHHVSERRASLGLTKTTGRGPYKRSADLSEHHNLILDNMDKNDAEIAKIISEKSGIKVARSRVQSYRLENIGSKETGITDEQRDLLIKWHPYKTTKEISKEIGVSIPKTA